MPSNRVLLFYNKSQRVELICDLKSQKWYIENTTTKKNQILFFKIHPKKKKAQIFSFTEKEEHYHPLMLLSLFIAALKQKSKQEDLASFLEQRYDSYLYYIKQIDQALLKEDR